MKIFEKDIWRIFLEKIFNEEYLIWGVKFNWNIQLEYPEIRIKTNMEILGAKYIKWEAVDKRLFCASQIKMRVPVRR